jgi:hypothetical protein
MQWDRVFIGLAAAAALTALGCGRQDSLLLPNQPPEVELFTQRLEAATTGPITYRFSWSAHDPDGRVDHFLYSFGTPADNDARRSWEGTSDREKILSFARTAPAGDSATGSAIEPRVFTLQAIDGSGARSTAARLALFDDNVAPTVAITDPIPNSLVRYSVNPTVCIEWGGEDLDGIRSKRPVKYKFKMLTATTEVTLQQANTNPDLVRQYYAPRNWAGWDSTGPSEPHRTYSGLTPNQEYMFVVTGFDEMGAYDPLFSRNTNMIYMRVTTAGTQLPTITMFNEYFLYSYTFGLFDPSPAITFEAPPGRPLTFSWHADPPRDNNGNLLGGPVKGYRWALDIADLTDNAPRSNEAADFNRWSAWSPLVTSVTLPPFEPSSFEPEPHVLYIEAMQGTGCSGSVSLPALGVVRFDVVRPTFNHDLLIVDDTRYILDKISIGTDCYNAANRPLGNWPTAAELDTFLYARGGVPWKCYPPAGTVLSSPGIFNGYSFDTLGTNLRIANLTVPLSRLGQYRHVIWMVDAAGALNSKPGTDSGDLAGPQTAMRYMNNNQRANTLAAYVGQGGRVWLVGSAATASMINFNRTLNDNALPAPQTLTFRNADNELLPGRFVYDQAHWRSEFKQYKVNVSSAGRIKRYLGRFESAPGPYGTLPIEIQLKSSGTDPFPPNRTGSQSVFYQTQFDVEFLSASNEILEDLDPGPGAVFQSTLDTLYKVTGSSLQPDTGPGALQSVVMTRYHGLDNEEFILTGFNIWSFRRAQCVTVVDFVLQQLWGLSRNPVAFDPASPATRTPRLPIGRQGPGASARRAGTPRGAPGD